MQITGKHIAGARALLGISQGDLAEAADVTWTTIQNFELGKHKPMPKTLQRITQVLEARGIEFTNGDGIGVRLRFNPTPDTKPPAP